MKKVEKLNKGLSGRITIPADKSISHRAVMLSSIANGFCTIENFSGGADCKSTVELFKQLGVDIFYSDEKTLRIFSNGILHSNTDFECTCGNSGTTMRLVTGILASRFFKSTLTGDESLSLRPMQRIIEPLMLMGADIESTEGHAPLIIHGKGLKGIKYHSDIASAQVKSSVLLAGLRAQGVTTYVEPYISRNHTELMLDYLGADITSDGNSVTVWSSELEAKDITIVGDISSAAFFIVAGLLVSDSDFIIENVGINPTRTGILDIVSRMGASVELLNEHVVSGEPVADIHVQYCENLKACIIEGDDIPRLIDELPIIAVLASQAEGETVVKNAEDLRNKESDRIKCLVSGLSSIGVDIEETEDGFIVRGKTQLEGGVEVESYRDHRLAMSFYVAGLLCKKEIAVRSFEWINISFPEFEKLMYNLICND
ncbi:3-phosphoshikimate 1-carboxyvinyltransferase [bacterium]|nr:3-phosphoshikimate 1-carboxyvinyltransferase [bacterium]